MKKHYTDTELTNALKRMEIVVDTREQENKHILTYLEERGVSTITRRIRTGDYSAQLDGIKTKAARPLIRCALSILFY